VVVTGASSGIGRVTALRFAQDGAKVVCFDINADVSATVKTITDAGGAAIAVVGDVCDPQQCKSVVAKTVETYGKLTILCNVAGILSVKHTTDESVQTWDKLIAVNLSGPFYLSQAALPQLLKHKGNIVNIGSTAAICGHGYMAAYCASKHAIVGLTRAMAVEYAKQGVRINVVCPGGIRTNIAAGMTFEADFDPNLIVRLQLTTDQAEPELTANVICYMASREAQYVTGALWSVDNGTTAV
jgi:NAD(P)-dependent dehydrogenase (short-subunit alcohol dehydrogenase family)